LIRWISASIAPQPARNAAASNDQPPLRLAAHPAQREQLVARIGRQPDAHLGIVGDALAGVTRRRASHAMAVRTVVDLGHSSTPLRMSTTAAPGVHAGATGIRHQRWT